MCNNSLPSTDMSLNVFPPNVCHYHCLTSWMTGLQLHFIALIYLPKCWLCVFDCQVMSKKFMSVILCKLYALDLEILGCDKFCYSNSIIITIPYRFSTLSLYFKLYSIPTLQHFWRKFCYSIDRICWIHFQFPHRNFSSYMNLILCLCMNFLTMKWH